MTTHENAELPTYADGNTSDGYHTFNELYEHRAALFAALTRLHSDLSWRSRSHHAGGEPMFDGYFITGMALPTGQVSYHVPLRHWDLFRGVSELDFAPAWDGHSPDDVVRRLNGWMA